MKQVVHMNKMWGSVHTIRELKVVVVDVIFIVHVQ